MNVIGHERGHEKQAQQQQCIDIDIDQQGIDIEQQKQHGAQKEDVDEDVCTADGVVYIYNQGCN